MATLTALSDRYYLKLAAAFVRGKAAQGAPVDLPAPLRLRPLEALSRENYEDVFQQGVAAGLRLHKFKRTISLSRVRRVLGALAGLAPAELLDIGSGRGVFLWPLLDELPHLPVTAIDHNSRRAIDLLAVRLGGVERLAAQEMDARALAFPDGSFDVVTILEVLEHIPDPERAVAEVVRVARRSVVLSVPSQEDDNPEHLHLFGQRRLRELFAEAGIKRINFAYVPGHLVAVARVAP